MIRLIHLHVLKHYHHFVLYQIAYVIIFMLSIWLLGGILYYRSSYQSSLITSASSLLFINVSGTDDSTECKIVTLFLRIVSTSCFIALFNLSALIQKGTFKKLKIKLQRINSICAISPKLQIPKDEYIKMTKSMKVCKDDSSIAKPFEAFSASMNKVLKTQILVKLLQQIICFKELPSEIFQYLIPCLRLQFINKGESLFNQGDISDSIYFLIQGRCAYMSRHQENKKTIPFVFINPGDTIGEIDYEGQSDLRVFACKALQDSYLLYFKSHVLC